MAEAAGCQGSDVLDGIQDLHVTSDSQEMSWSHKLEQAKAHKQAGNDKYKDGAMKQAIGQYHRALLYLRGISKRDEDVPFANDPRRTFLSEAVKEEVAQLTIQCHNNLSACILQSETPTYEKVAQYSDNVLEESPSNVKALYRRGVATYHLGQPEDALTYLETALKQPIGRRDPNIKKYMKMCEAAVSEQDRNMKDTYRAMFSS